jgi:hypothetical protein
MISGPWLKTSIMAGRGSAEGQAGLRHELRALVDPECLDFEKNIWSGEISQQRGGVRQ